jgi:uncharacterized protein (TIGR04255 family)
MSERRGAFVKMELDLLGLPDASRVPLRNAPLVLALCQVRFSSMISVSDPTSLTAFQRAIKSKYPVAVPAQEIELLVGIGSPDSGLRGEQRRSSQWQFTDQEDNWKIVLAQDFLTLETRNYEHFDDFLSRLHEALDALVEHIQPTIVTRIGLRYVNEIRLDELQDMDWFDILRKDLLGAIAVPELVQNTIQVAAVQQLVLRYPHDLGINIHHGLIPTGTTVRLRVNEEPPTRPFYLLDFDVFRDFPLPRALDMNRNIICQYVESYHKMIYRLFRWSVTEQYISTMEK